MPIKILSTGCHNCPLHSDFEGTDHECLHPDSELDEDTLRNSWWADKMPSNCPLLKESVLVIAKKGAAHHE